MSDSNDKIDGLEKSETHQVSENKIDCDKEIAQIISEDELHQFNEVEESI